MVLVQQAARSSNDSSLWDIADGIYKDVEGYISKEAQVKAFALLMYNKGLEDAQNAETVAKLCSRLASLEAEGLKFRSPLLKQLQVNFLFQHFAGNTFIFILSSSVIYRLYRAPLQNNPTCIE